MRKPLSMLLLLVLLLTVMTGCTQDVDPQPSATALATATPTPVPEETENATNPVYTTVGEESVIQVSGKDLTEKAYYDADGNLLVPVKPVMEALGWKVEGPDGTGETEMKLTREEGVSHAKGQTTPAEQIAQEAAEDAKVETSPEAENMAAEEIIIRFTLPATDGAAEVSGVTVSKMAEDKDIGDTLPWIDGMLYASEDWLDAVFEDLSIEYDGEKTISVMRDE